MALRSSKKGFLQNYSQDDTYLVRPDRKHGKAGIFSARDSDSREVLVKFWPRKKGIDDSDLEDIWRSEIRQLQRLAAVPRADDLFVQMVASGKDKDGFYLILDPGQGSPLAVFLDAAKKPEPLARARQPQYRRLLWENALRLAEALELLHSQGVIHRNLDPWSVVTAFPGEPDFRLTGFEWSMRIASVDAKAAKKVKSPRAINSFSFARDWGDLANLFAVFLGIPIAPLNDVKVVPSRVADHATATEVRLLRAMLGLETVERLDGEFVCNRIKEIIDSVAAVAAGKDAKICLAVRLGTGSRLSEAIRKASKNDIEIDELDQQIRFLLDDLGRQPQLVATRTKTGPLTRYALVGNSLTYLLAPYRQPRTQEEGNWEFAYCERVHESAPHPASVVGSTLLSAKTLDTFQIREAAEKFPRMRGKVQRWDNYLTRTEKTELRKSDLERLHQSLALLLVLEMAFAAADIFPVEIISRSVGPSAEVHNLSVVSRSDAAREELSNVLGIDAPAVRLKKLIDADDLQEDVSWTLSEPGMLGERTPTTTNWRFLRWGRINDIECLVLEGAVETSQRSNGFLAPADMIGRITQFKRRLKALSALKDHAELSRMLIDPRIRIEDSQDPLDDTDASFHDLDSSKQQALREIISTIPLFLLQGPPGVGKTYLVGNLVRRSFDDEPTTRILLSAQSNSAIDHLMNEVRTVFPDSDESVRPLMVRARAADDEDSAGELEIDVQAARILKDLAKSKLVKAASKGVRNRVLALAEARKEIEKPSMGITSAGTSTGRRMSAELRSLEGMILRAANLVFATTNSAAVERLIDEAGLFDWTIVEEAGKATGGELLSPLLLSHRRLMIGDHKQLPPFDIEKLTKILASTTKVMEITSLVDGLISRYLKDPGIDEIFQDFETKDSDLGDVCADTLAILTLFETFVENEFERQSSKGTGRAIARRLNEQHRMHPAIARIVSRCFYDGTLVTNPLREEKFLNTEPPFVSIDKAKLPELPIVFVDMPYTREERPGGTAGDKPPPWSNPDEVAAVETVLKMLRSREIGSEPSLAILSPYREQVSAMRRMLTRNDVGTLAHLTSFRPAVDTNEFCGTVDSFQGGEADLVIVSLVRNNAHATPAKALGFLRDNRRMNVLLSRAKWRLVLVGSLEFYKRILELSKNLSDQDIGFVGEFVQALDGAIKAKEACIVPWSDLQDSP